jgi:flavodoxin
MKTLVIYDSVYGNTEKIARAIGDGLSSKSKEVEVVSTGEVNPSELNEHDLLIVGGPTHGGRPSPDLKEFLDQIPEGSLESLKVSAFDTRTAGENQKIWVRMITGVLGFAAGRIGKILVNKGGELIAEPEGFNVVGREGPLEGGELDRARNWGSVLLD